MSHTKARWKLNHNTNWKTNPFSVTVRAYGVHSTTIANIPTRTRVPPQEQMANARLIATAPELLDALKAMLEHCPDTECNDDIVRAVAVAKSVVRRAEEGDAQQVDR